MIFTKTVPCRGTTLENSPSNTPRSFCRHRSRTFCFPLIPSSLHVTDDLHIHLVAIEQPDRERAVGERPRPYLELILLRDAIGRLAERILVHREHLVVRHEVELEVVHLREIVAEQERRREQRPERDVDVLLVRRETRVAEARTPTHLADHEHVRIVPMSGRRELRVADLLEADARHALPRVRDVARRAPRVALDPLLGAPLPHVAPPVLAE